MGLKVKINDGGRKAAGYRFTHKLCLIRATAIATGHAYQDVLNALGEDCCSKVPHRFRDYMLQYGWAYIPVVGRPKMADWTAPTGKLVVSVDSHHVALVDGVIHDIIRNATEGERIVHGYWTNKNGHDVDESCCKNLSEMLA